MIRVASTACDGLVQDSHLRDALASPKTNVLIFRYTSEWRRTSSIERVTGFLVGQYDEVTRDFYTDVVCAEKGSKGGSLLMRTALALARELGAKTASLKALPHVIPYYYRFGFRAISADPCTMNGPPTRRGSNKYGYDMRKCLGNMRNDWNMNHFPHAWRMPNAA